MKTTPSGLNRAAQAEVRNAPLPDKRLNKRLERITSQMIQDPAASFPQALGGEANLEGAYRFFNNARVTSQAILAPHISQTLQRAAEVGRVFCIHDTTLCQFRGETQRQGLGPLRKKKSFCKRKSTKTDQGFLCHATLLVSDDGKREPLGLAALSTRVRGQAKKNRRASARRKDPQNEARRWVEHVEQTEQRLDGLCSCVHLMDREADSYALLCVLREKNFVVRAAHDRVVALPCALRPSTPEKLSEVLARAQIVLEREVPICKRQSKQIHAQSIHPDRQARVARLALSAQKVVLHRSNAVAATWPPTLPVNVVRVVEVDTPAGQPPVQWVLLTNLPIDTPEQVAAIVDAYCVRWLIEEYFKALKTGCNYEGRQLQSLHALVNALSVLAPMAWQLLRLRHLSRSQEASALRVLTPTQVQILRTLSSQPLPANPTAEQALRAVAQMGGHLRRNGAPGWQTLWRGYHALLLIELGWSARRKAEKCDLS